MKSFTQSSYFSCEEIWKVGLEGFAISDTLNAGVLVDAKVNIGDAVSLVLVSGMMVASERGKEAEGRYGATKYLDVSSGAPGVASVETESVSSLLK